MTTCPGLFSAHDSNLIALPADIVKVRDARVLAESHMRDLDAPPHHLEAREQLTARTVEAFLAGQPVPPIDQVLDAERESRAFEHRLEVARNAVAALDRKTSESIAEAADDIIAEVIRPVFDSIVSELRDAYTLLEPFEGAGRGALALAEARVRKAAGTADTHTNTYTVLTQAAREVRALLPAPEYDADGEFTVWRDIHTVWPRERRTNFGALPAPWESAADPFAWQIRNLTAWLPTPAEQDAEWLAVYGEAMKRQQVIREKGRATAATYGQGH